MIISILFSRFWLTVQIRAIMNFKNSWKLTSLVIQSYATWYRYRYFQAWKGSLNRTIRIIEAIYSNLRRSSRIHGEGRGQTIDLWRVPILVPLCSRSRYIRNTMFRDVHAAIRAIAPIDRKWNYVVFVRRYPSEFDCTAWEIKFFRYTLGFRICRSEINNNLLDVQFLELVNLLSVMLNI